MADLHWQGEPDLPSLRRAIRHRLRGLEPRLRIVAEAFRAHSTAIDLLGVGPEGEFVSVRIARPDDEARAFTRALSDLPWLRSRAADLAQLAPELGLEASAEPRAILCAAGFETETRAAAEGLPEGPIALVSYRCLRRSGQLDVLLETEWPGKMRAVAKDGKGPAMAPEATEAPGRSLAATSMKIEPAAMTSSTPRPTRTAPPSTSHFRTGLTDADLQIDGIDR